MTYMLLEERKFRNYSALVFGCLFVLALINPKSYMVLVGLWGVICSIVCPLIVTVLPGAFFYYILKEKDIKDRRLTAAALAYAGIGILILPIYLTFSTKNLFLATSTQK